MWKVQHQHQSALLRVQHPNLIVMKHQGSRGPFHQVVLVLFLHFSAPSQAPTRLALVDIESSHHTRPHHTSSTRIWSLLDTFGRNGRSCATPELPLTGDPRRPQSILDEVLEVCIHVFSSQECDCGRAVSHPVTPSPPSPHLIPRPALALSTVELYWLRPSAACSRVFQFAGV